MAITSSSKPLAAVTGASSGIGFELARQFARHGHDLVVCADDIGVTAAAQTFELEGASVRAIKLDLRTSEGVERFYEEIRAAGVPLEAIAINAGVGVSGDFARETDLREELAMIHLNVVSTVHLAKLAAADMVAEGRGRILITSSIAGLMPAPLSAVYAATKAFDFSLAQSLHHELKGTGVSVTALIPGPTDTEFFARAGMEDTRTAREAEKNAPADVARQAYDALMAGKARVYGASSLATKLQAAMARFIPPTLTAELHRRNAEHSFRQQ
jgi:short-subunit dehydrogenase